MVMTNQLTHNWGKELHKAAKWIAAHSYRKTASGIWIGPDNMPIDLAIVLAKYMYENLTTGGDAGELKKSAE